MRGSPWDFCSKKSSIIEIDVSIHVFNDQVWELFLWTYSYGRSVNPSGCSISPFVMLAFRLFFRCVHASLLVGPSETRFFFSRPGMKEYQNISLDIHFGQSLSLRQSLSDNPSLGQSLSRTISFPDNLPGNLSLRQPLSRTICHMSDASLYPRPWVLVFRGQRPQRGDALQNAREVGWANQAYDTRLKESRKDGQMNGPLDRQTDGPTDGRIKISGSRNAQLIFPHKLYSIWYHIARIKSLNPCFEQCFKTFRIITYLLQSAESAWKIERRRKRKRGN